MPLDAFGVQRTVRKAYQPGAITAHQEQANLHARKKTSGRRQVEAGLATSGAGLAAATALEGDAPQRKIRTKVTQLHLSGRPKLARAAMKTVRYGPAAVAAGGLGLAGVGVSRRVYHGAKQNEQTKAAQSARRERNASLAKAYDPERQRHRRANAAEGATAGAAVVAGVGARKARGISRTFAGHSTTERIASREEFRQVGERIKRHGMTGSGSLPPTAGNIKSTGATFASATGHDEASRNAARAAWRTGRRAKGRAGLAVGLAGAAGAIHHHDRHGGGHSYA